MVHLCENWKTDNRAPAHPRTLRQYHSEGNRALIRKHVLVALCAALPEFLLRGCQALSLPLSFCLHQFFRCAATQVTTESISCGDIGWPARFERQSGFPKSERPTTTVVRKPCSLTRFRKFGSTIEPPGPP